LSELEIFKLDTAVGWSAITHININSVKLATTATRIRFLTITYSFVQSYKQKIAVNKYLHYSQAVYQSKIAVNIQVIKKENENSAMCIV